MFYNFNKESLFFISNFSKKNIKLLDNRSVRDYREEEKKTINLRYLSEFLSHFFFLTYYLDLSQCNSIVILEKIPYNINVLKKLFPQLKFYYSQLDLKYLSQNDIKFVLISNDNMVFNRKIVEKYDPFMALLDFKIEKGDNYYLEGVLLRKLFSSDNSAKLVVRGISYRKWENIHIEDMSEKNYVNPISDDNKTIYKERGFYNNFDETATTVIIIDYLEKINLDIKYENVLKILIYILDNLIEGKKINLDIEYLLN